ncbi:ABC transporter ATP-binding protein [Parachitinimonas caeni]|uniref:ABC transporter ATP-binding protein n=1 Tax=Parachitinimonas caeni TaxID=3031301 RepID=A0ABT7DUZ2_9NEIS|nr:ABC transporter ATP-binding protein [Parachitinimonas caeni]MDK2123890.1 ABC transporter ATP-binding protein [Parachitinimonas caeni]
MSQQPVLQMQQVIKSYHGARSQQVLRGLDLAVAPGEYVAVIGESGVGKSTLLNLLAGLDQPDSGEVRVKGQLLSALNDNEATLLRRRHIGFVFQAFHVLPQLSVWQNVRLPLALNGLPDDGIDAMLVAVGLAEKAQRKPRELSGGEMQRVSIARALIHQPDLLLADEPTGNLDPETARTILDLLKSRLRATGAAGILVTHSMLAAATADRVLKLTPDGLIAVAP